MVWYPGNGSVDPLASLLRSGDENLAGERTYGIVCDLAEPWQWIREGLHRVTRNGDGTVVEGDDGPGREVQRHGRLISYLPRGDCKIRDEAEGRRLRDMRRRDMIVGESIIHIPMRTLLLLRNRRLGTELGERE